MIQTSIPLRFPKSSGRSGFFFEKKLFMEFGSLSA